MNFDDLKSSIKKKILLWIAPAIPFILLFLIIIIVLVSILSPVVMAKDSSSTNNDEDGGFFEKFGNFLSGNGWTSDEIAFWEIIEKNNLDCKQSTLVTATIMYYYQSNPTETLDYGEEPSDDVQNSSETDSNSNETTITPSDDMYSEVPYGQVLPDLKRLVKKMKKGFTAYEKYVKETFLKKEPYNKLLIGYSDEEKRIDEIYEEINIISDTMECVSRSSYGGAVCSFNIGSESATDIKVRILRCGNLDGDYSPLENEELIDFEKYITGVVYPEVGPGAPLDTMKAQAVAARSYAIARSLGKGDIQEENGQTILSIKSCTADQAYCDPDVGCWSYADGGEMNFGTRLGVDASIHSGEDTTKRWSRPPLPEDSPIRQAVEETVGETLVNSDGRPILASYGSGIQISWSSMANNGSDYYEILMKTYSSVATDIASNCTFSNISSIGEFTNWKQYDPQWKFDPLGNSTIGNIGCAATSVAIQIASSGTEILIEDFNPSTFVKALSKKDCGGFTSSGAIVWEKTTCVAPNFQYVGYGEAIAGNSKSEIIRKIKNQISQGYYVILRVKRAPNQHWVAVERVDDNNIYMFDPASASNSVLDVYSLSGLTEMRVYKKLD
ncbi:MAG: SpoIID/LytB domain-containing protein [Bacilli bacterium]|nr:SpoIID/LytB domain-containing protein [Bacilli bacterium]